MSADEGFFEGFLDDYFAESEEHLAAAADALLALEKSLGNEAAERAAVDDLFRYFHTLKAISAMVELRPAEHLAHSLENYLRAIRDHEIDLSADGSDVLIDGTRRLEQIIDARRRQHDQPSIADIVERVERLAPEHPARRPPVDKVVEVIESKGGHRWVCTFAPTRELIAAGTGVDTIRKRIADVAKIVEAVPLVGSDGSITFQFIVEAAADVNVAASFADVPVTAVRADVNAPLALPLQELSGPAATSHVVRVDLARLDDLMQSIGDLVISRARLTDSLARIERHVPPVEWRAVQDNALTIDRQLRTLREGIMRVRLVPVGEIFRRMPFVVRDLARENGKKVTLELRGQGTEIDKYLIERMMDPVLHLVRNAVSHGIEPPAVRIARGKKPEGIITMTASTAGDMVALEIADDGQGVDGNAVVEKARRAGLPIPAGELDAPALLALLCSPGLSTKDETDRASGRGVGMAVVKETIDQLSGTMVLETTKGEGTRFLIQLPLTLAIADALIGRVGAEVFAVPQNAVREVVAANAGDIRQIEENELLPHRDGALPLIRLSRLFGIPNASTEHMHVFVIGTGANALGIAVDRIVGQREIVVRAISDPLARVDGISGATDLGDGRVVLILDPAALTRLTRQRAARALGSVEQWGRLRA